VCEDVDDDDAVEVEKTGADQAGAEEVERSSKSEKRESLEAEVRKTKKKSFHTLRPIHSHH